MVEYEGGYARTQIPGLWFAQQRGPHAPQGACVSVPEVTACYESILKFPDFTLPGCRRKVQILA